MELKQILLNRRSVRAYQDRVVDPAALDAVFSAAVRAPSAGGLQAFRIHAVANPALRKALAAAAHGQAFIATAPIVLLFCADSRRAEQYGTSNERNYSVQDGIIAAVYAQLAATELGLATCWIGAFDAPLIASALELPEAEHPVALLTVGYSAESPEEPPRRPVSDVVQWHGAG